MNNKAIDVPIYGGYDRQVQCSDSPEESDFLNPKIESVDDIKNYCDKYKEKYPTLEAVSTLLSQPGSTWYSGLSIPMSVLEATETVGAPNGELFKAMRGVFSSEDLEEILKYNNISGTINSLNIGASFIDFSVKLTSESIKNILFKGAEVLPYAESPAIAMQGVDFSSSSPTYKGIDVFFPAVIFLASRLGKNFPIKLPPSVLSKFSPEGSEISFYEFLNKHVE